MIQRSVQLSYGFARYTCPLCGRRLIPSTETKLVKKTDPDSDYWYGISECMGVWPTQLIPLKITYSVMKCPICLQAFLEKDLLEQKISWKDRKNIFPKTIEKNKKCPKCGEKMKSWVRRVRNGCLQGSSEVVSPLSIGNEPINGLIRYHLCPKCKNEIYPDWNFSVKVL